MSSKGAIAAGAVAVAIVAIVVMVIAGASGSSSNVTAIAVSGSPRGIALGEGATWVSRYDDGQLERISASSGKAEGVDVGPHPNLVVAAEGSIWAGVNDDRDLARIEPYTREITKQQPFIAGCGCAMSDFEIRREALWVSSAERHVIKMFDMATGTRLGLGYHPGLAFDGPFALREHVAWGTENYGGGGSGLLHIDLNNGWKKHFPVRTGSDFSGIAEGEDTVWIADAERGQVVAFDPKTRKVAADIEVDGGVVGDNLAVAGKSVFAWNADSGVLTQIDAETRKVVATTTVDGYTTGQAVNREWSDLAVNDAAAWVTDPAGDTVYEIEY